MNSRMLRRLLLFIAFAGTATVLPAAGTSPPDGMMTALAFVVALLGLVFGLVVATIAWAAAEWSPSLLAAACITMATASVAGVLLSGAGLGLVPGPGADWLPALGLVLGSGWFALSVAPHSPLDGCDGRGPRLVLPAATLATVALCLALAAWPAIVPGRILRDVLAGAAAMGYLYAGGRLCSVYRFLRLPSQLAMALGCGVLIVLSLPVVVGGVRGVPVLALHAIALIAAALPAAGFMMESRARPGLRTMVLGLFFPGAIEHMRRGYPQALKRLIVEASAYDESLRGHLDRVADLSVRVGVRLKLETTELRELMLAAQVHDIGKLFVPLAILNKRGRLNDSEMDIVRQHAELGAGVLSRVPALAGVARAVAEHHERWDGAGYPAGKCGEAISHVARILAVVDVYDALMSARAYKPAWTTDNSLTELERNAGSQFDPAIVAELCSLVRSELPSAGELPVDSSTRATEFPATAAVSEPDSLFRKIFDHSINIVRKPTVAPDSCYPGRDCARTRLQSSPTVRQRPSPDRLDYPQEVI